MFTFLKLGFLNLLLLLLLLFLLQLLKPAFTILRDRNSKSIFLVIRGALSIKDKLTAATAELVPFQHLVPNDGCNSIMGYAHCGMVAAANWIAKCATPCLLQAVKKYPDYHLKVFTLISDSSQGFYS